MTSHPAASTPNPADASARRVWRIAVIPGDGIGLEVVPEGVRVLQAAASRFGIELHLEEFDFASCDYYLRHGSMLPPNWEQVLGDFDAIFFGAVGWPDKVPDHVSLWGSLLQFRRVFDQYVNLRPARLMPGVRSPLAGREAGDIDLLIVRENTEGEYSDCGGRMFSGTDREMVMQETIMTRFGVDRVLEFAFSQAQRRARRLLSSATKSNGISRTMPFWDERVRAVAARHPEVSWNQFHIDALCARLVQRPQDFDVIVGSNLFGDILSDLAPALCGTLGIAPSANLNPQRSAPSLFEPVHGSAPDIAGRGVANPIGQIWSAAMMLDFFGRRDAHDAVVAAIEAALDPSGQAPRTPDLGGSAGTGDLGRAIAAEVARAA